MLRTAIVGLGAWGRTLVTSVQGTGAALRFTAGVTRTPARAASFCREHGISLVDRYDSVLADPDIDAVVLATPNSQHATQVIQAAAARKHVFCEKPFALSVASAREAIAAVERAQVTLAVGLNRRFHPSMQELQRRVAAGALGVVGTIITDLTATSGFYRPAGSWRVNPMEEPAGAMASIGVHLVDAMIWIAGPVREVHCIAGHRAGPNGDDTTSLMLRFDSGVTGLAFCSVVAARHGRVAVYGSKGFAEVLGATMDTFRFVPAVEGRASHLARAPEPETIETRGFNSVAEELAQFARAALAGTRHPVPYADVVHGIAVLEAAVRSAASSRPEFITN